MNEDIKSYKKAPFELKQITIDRLPGFPHGLNPMKDLAKNINIIAGPNGSGKSSTASFIQNLIWQNNGSAISGSAVAKIDEENWFFSVESGLYDVQKEGEKANLPLPTDCFGKHYTLALHDLVTTAEGDIAKKIITEAAGGVDIEKSEKELNYDNKIKSITGSVFANFDKLTKDEKETQNKQIELKKREHSLEELYKEKAECSIAAYKATLLNNIKEYFNEKKTLNELKLKLDTYPECMDKVQNDHYKRVEDAEENIDKNINLIEEYKNNIARSKEEIEKLNIESNVVDKSIINEIEKRVAALENKKREIDSNSDELEKKVSNEKILRKRVAESPSSPAPFTHSDLEELDRLIERAHQVGGSLNINKIKLERAQKHLNKIEQKSDEKDDDKAKEARSLLQDWLATTNQNIFNQKRIKNQLLKGFILSVGVFLLAFLLVMALFYAGIIRLPQGLTNILQSTDPLYFIVTTATVAAATILSSVKISNIAKEQKRVAYTIKEIEDKYNRLKPEDIVEKLPVKLLNNSSTRDEVKKSEEALSNQISKNDSEREKRVTLISEIEDLNAEKEGLLKEYESIKEEQKKCAHHFTKNAVLPEGLNSEKYTVLFEYIRNIREWFTSVKEIEEIKAINKMRESEFENELKICNELFFKTYKRGAEDLIKAKVILEEIKDNFEHLNREKNNIESFNRDIDNCEIIINQHTKKREEIFNTLSSANNGKLITQKEEVKELTSMLDKYKEAKESYSKKHYFVDSTINKIKRDKHFNEIEKEIVESECLESLQQEVEKWEALSQKKEEVTDKISKIETEIEQAKEKGDLENIIYEKEKSLDNVEKEFSNNLSSITGKIVTDVIKEESDKKNQPKVLQRASELFVNITHGKYKIKVIEENSSAIFKAIDVNNRNTLAMEQMSTGTRIQLLIAVRLAFVEMQEREVAYPVLADELLANSDDERAQVIINSLLEISRDGRQIFYFTAQSDEILKWEEALAKRNGESITETFDYKVITLADNKLKGIKRGGTKASALHLYKNVPKPEGRSYSEYFKELKVTPFLPEEDEVNSIHIALLTNRCTLIYTILSKGLVTWGELNNYINYNGEINCEDFSQEYKIMQEKAQLLQLWSSLLKRGQNRKIDSEVLKEAKKQKAGITDSYYDKILERLTLPHVKGDPEKLIKELRDNKIPRFSETKIDTLNKFFLDMEYINSEEKPAKEEVTISVKAALSKMRYLNEKEAQSLIDSILHQKI
ncbi:hypothetical protein QA597_11455 [Marinilabiliaceae bacterium ANBcel2]|nr:hypothetical protein [Marinilabiliaceae bacterium ANBcel2]